MKKILVLLLLVSCSKDFFYMPYGSKKIVKKEINKNDHQVQKDIEKSIESDIKKQITETKLPEAYKDETLLNEAKDLFKPLVKYQIKNQKLVDLGKKLYLDASLSKNGKISCNSCHRLDTFGVDNEVTSPGHDGTRGGRNSPSSFNAASNLAQFWDGRAKDLEEQALGPLLNPIEHGLASKEEVLAKLNTDEYKKLFKEAFGKEDAKTFENVGVAIAEFERTLVTPGKFDQFLSGDFNALNEDEKRGLRKFISIGCTSCHYGATLGGQDYQKLGLVEDYPTKDLGRFEVTKDEDDKFVFKVPNLRNIEKTGPYLHDGSIASLEEMIKIMAKHQIGEKITDEDVKDIKSFLVSLTGSL